MLDVVIRNDNAIWMGCNECVRRFFSQDQVAPSDVPGDQETDTDRDTCQSLQVERPCLHVL